MKKEYIDVKWIHDNYEVYPCRLVSELDKDRFEIRKLEYFKNGVVQFANDKMQSGDTHLGYVETPLLGVINQDSEFNGKVITQSQFESLWAEALKNTILEP